MKHTVYHLKDIFPFLGENGRDPRLTTYLPYNMVEMGRQDRLRPCLLICPGGGYTFNSEREAETIAVHFLPEGYNVFILNYSVAPNRFPCQLREVAAAMELIHANAKEWNCDVSRIAIMGFSAGGHLSAHYSNSYDIPEVREVFPDSKPVKLSVLSYPVITPDPRHAHTGSFHALTGHYPLTEAETEKFDCHKLVTGRTPPAFLWSTSNDEIVPVMNSLLYAQALTAHGVPYSLHIYPKGFHGLCTADDQTNDTLDPLTALTSDWLPAVKKWLKQTL